MSNDALTMIVSVVGTGAGVTAIVGWWKDRKKDTANAKLTDVQALQAEIVALTDVTKYLREENANLRKDYVTSEKARRSMYLEVQQLQKELGQVQSHCERLNSQLKALLGREPHAA